MAEQIAIISFKTLEEIRNKACKDCVGCNKVKYAFECKKHCSKWFDLKFKETARSVRMGLVRI